MRTSVVLFLSLVKCFSALDFATKNCNTGDGLTLDGSHAVFNDSSGNYEPCRVESDIRFPVDVDYTIEVQFKTVGNSMPGIIYNVQSDFDYDIVYFRTNDYNCLIFGSFENNFYTEHGVEYCDITIKHETWFQVKLEVLSASVVVTIDSHEATTYATKIPQTPTLGFIHGLGYKSNFCAPNCQFYFREIKFGSDTEPEIYNTERGTLPIPGKNINTLYIQRLEFQDIGHIPGTYCFVAFYYEYLSIEGANIYIQDVSEHEQGDVKIYSTPSVYLDVYFYSTVNDPGHAYRISYHVFACGIQEDDLSFMCESGRHTELVSDFHRSTNFERDPNNPHSDHNLPMDWYRFNSCAGERIPQESPGMGNVCGTRDPIWLQALSPDPGPGGIYEQGACVYQGEGADCAQNWTIPVYHCHLDFNLYYLVGTPQDSGYCVGSGLACDPSKNETSIGGTGCSPCAEAVFPILTDPPTVDDWTIGEQNIYNLPCEVHEPDTTLDILYNIEWLVDYGTHTENLMGVEGSTDTTLLLPSRLLTHSYMQNHVYCRAQGRYHVGQEYGPWIESARRFIGLQIEDTSKDMDITNGPTYRLGFQFNVPINCQGNNCLDPTKDCFIDVYSVTTTRGLRHQPCMNSLYVESIPIHEHGCSVRVDCSRWNIVHYHTIAAKDTKQIGRESYLHTTYLVTKSGRSMWNNLLTQTSLRITPDDALGGSSKKRCKSTTDPHITTTHSCRYQLHRSGEYVMYKSTPKDEPDMEVVVTAKLRSCTSREHCNQALGVRVKNEAIVIEPGVSPSHRYMGPGYGEDGFKLTASSSFSSYYITLPRGEKLTASRISGTNLNIYIDESGDEQFSGIGNGLCGKIRPPWPSSEGDLTDRDGQRFRPDCRGSSINSDFSNGWKVIPGEEIIDRSQINTKNSSLSMDTYQCTVFDINDFLGADEWVFKNSLVVEPCILHNPDNLLDQLRAEALRNGYRSMSKKPLKSVEANLIKNKQSVTEWTNETATQFCHDYIFGSSAAQSCMAIDEVEIVESVQECALDTVMSGDTTWAVDTLNGMRESCVSNLFKNLSMWEFEEKGNETVFKPPSDLTEDLCPSECSGNGNCVDGNCVCLNGFIGFDCAMEETTPPKLHQIYQGEICYAEECDKIRIQGENFVDAQDLTCHFTVQGITNNFNGSMWNYDMVSCSLPPFDHTPEGYVIYSVKISNDGVHTSDGTEVMLVNSPCLMNCALTDTDDSPCEVQSSKCFIEGKCIEEGYISPSDVCQSCVPALAQQTWTTLQGCGDDPGADGGLSSLHIILISIGCVVVVTGAVLGLLTGIYVRRSNRVKPASSMKPNGTNDTETQSKDAETGIAKVNI